MKGAGSGRRVLRMLLLSLLLLIGGFIWLVSYTYSVPSTDAELNLSRLNELTDADRIAAATLLDQDARILGRLCDQPLVDPPPTATPDRANGEAPPAICPGKISTFLVSYPSSDVATEQLIERIAAKAPLSVDKQSSKSVAKTVITFIFPLAMLANLFGLIFVSKSGESSIADIVGFGRIGKKRKNRPGSEITFADVAGAEEAVAELREVTEYLKDPKRFEAYGAAAPKGVLLFGSPGCGKTLLARAVAGESGVAFFSISGADFVESLVGVGAARVRDLFAQVREVAPAIVFIDEIDAVGRRREGEGVSGGEREQTVNQLLVEMDGFEVSAGIVVMAATNRPDILDPALMRPGRFDRHVTVSPPDVHGREAILELHARGKHISPQVDFAFIARRTPGFTGADLANVINEGALLAIREGEGATVGPDHLSEAVLRVLHGPRRRGLLMSPEERLRLAHHEAGHALVAAAVGQGAEVHRVSIVARGQGLGQSTMTDEAERVLHTRSDLAASLAVAMGGIAAEEMSFGESSTTAEDDLQKATTLARQMVGLYGMSAAVGRVSLMATSGSYLGGEAAMDMVSGPTLASFDQAVKDLLEAAERHAGEILSRNRDVLGRLVAALDAEETLEGAQLQSLLGGVIPDTTSSVDPSRNGRAGLDEAERAAARRRAR